MKLSKKFTACLLGALLLAGSPVFSQINLDSLEISLEKSPSDSIRLINLIDLSKGYQYKNLSRAEAFSEQAFALAEKRNWYWGKSKAYAQKAFLATIRGDFATAMKFDNKNLTVVMEAGDSTLLAEALNYLGNDYSDMEKYDESYYYFTQSYRIARAIDDSLKMAVSIFNIGNVLTELGQYDLALDHFRISSEISTAINDLDGVPYTQQAVGHLYLKKKEFDKSENYLIKALQGIRSRNITVIEPRNAKWLAELYFEKKDFEKARAYYDTAAALYRQSSNEFGVAEVNLGISRMLINQAGFDEAQGLIERSLETAKAFKAKRMEISCYEQLSKLAEKKGNYKDALAYHKSFKQMEDSLFSQGMTEKIFQDQLRSSTEKKDLEIAALSRVKSEQDSTLRRQEFVRNILVVVVALTAIMLFTIYRSSQRRKRINNLLIEHQAEIKKRSAELQQLNQVKDKFFSIISHDLRSPINALSGLLNLVDNNQITPSEFANLTRELKVQFNHTRTLINNLLDWALLQMDKLKIQPEKIDLQVVVDENFKLLSSLQLKEINLVNKIPSGFMGWGDLNMINLVFRNLILNAIKFSEIGGRIEVSAKEKDDFYVVAIQDHGVGIRKDVQKILFEKTSGYSTRGTANEKGTGLGLILCKEFVEKNGGQIWLESEEGKGSTFYFSIKRA